MSTEQQEWSREWEEKHGHKHTWHLAGHYNGHLIDVGEHMKSYKPPEARWLCPCGAQKLTEVTDLAAMSLEPSKSLANPPSDPKRKANT